MNILFFILMLISTGGLIASNVLEFIEPSVIFKCLSSTLFIATAMCSYKKNPSNTKFFMLMFLGLFFSLGGDVLLALDFITISFFAIGVLSFGIGHILFSLGYCSMTKIVKKDILIFFCFFIPTVLTILIGKFDFKGMKSLIVIYAVIISFMVAKSLSMLKFYSNSKKPVLLMIFGSVLFFISDWVLLYTLFYPNVIANLGVVNSILYYLGQGLLALSFAHPLNGETVIEKKSSRIAA